MMQGAQPERALRRADHVYRAGADQPFNNNQPVTVQQNTIGNTAPAGNRAQHRGRHRAAAPGWAPGLNLSVDYYRIKVKGVVFAQRSRK
jgi:hypothetical protein